MALDPDFLRILVCPRTRKPLQVASAKQLAAVNEAIQGGQVRNRSGGPVANPLQEGLLPEGETEIYPVVEGIPVLLVDEAIPMPGHETAADDGEVDGRDRPAHAASD